MERKEEIITVSGNHTFGDNYNLNFIHDDDFGLNYCNINCGNYCDVFCGSTSNIKCGNYCDVFCGSTSNIKCGNFCEIDCGNDCNITCGNNCKIVCTFCNVTCGNNCEIESGHDSNIICGDNCKILCGECCSIKPGVGSQLVKYSKISKTISKDEAGIWWYVKYFDFINTYKDVNWQKNNPEKFKELYPFVHNELDSSTLF